MVLIAKAATKRWDLVTHLNKHDTLSYDEFVEVIIKSISHDTKKPNVITVGQSFDFKAWPKGRLPKSRRLDGHVFTCSMVWCRSSKVGPRLIDPAWSICYRPIFLTLLVSCRWVHQGEKHGFFSF